MLFYIKIQICNKPEVRLEKFACYSRKAWFLRLQYNLKIKNSLNNGRVNAATLTRFKHVPLLLGGAGYKGIHVGHVV